MEIMTSPNRRRARLLRMSVAASAAALVLAGCGDDTTPTATDPEASDPPSSSAPAPSEPTSDAPAETDGPASTITVPVYFAGTGPRGPVLFREFRQVEDDNPMDEAVALLFAGDALDPDYGSPFPDGAIPVGTSFDGTGSGGTIGVELADDGLVERPAGMSKAEARVAVQSLVYTLQGVVQARAKLVAYSADGQPTSLLGIDTSGGVKNASQLDVLNLVSVTTPQEGASVSGTFTASGVGSSFEATIPWEVRQGDQVVKEGFATAEGWMDRLYPWETEVDVSGLAPGDYTFAAMTDDPSGGEGFGPSEDTKTITVE